MSWRFIPYFCFDAAMNMAIDEYLLEAHLSGKIPPTLRLYGFDPPAITIGRNQFFPEEAIQRGRERGFAVARRPTGGRAVLHHKDITYAFIGSEIGHGPDGVLEASVTGAYKQISGGLQAAFDRFGLRADLGQANSAYRDLSDCFLATTQADLHIDGLKLAGSAQLRRRTAVLQHGSIPLSLEQGLMQEILSGVSEDRQSYRRHANLFQLAGRSIPISELEEAFKSGFEQAFSIELLRSELTESELVAAGELKQLISLA